LLNKIDCTVEQIIIPANLFIASFVASQALHRSFINEASALLLVALLIF